MPVQMASVPPRPPRVAQAVAPTRPSASGGGSGLHRAALQSSVTPPGLTVPKAPTHVPHRSE